MTRYFWVLGILLLALVPGCAAPPAPGLQSEQTPAAELTPAPTSTIPKEEEPIKMEMPAAAEPAVMAARRDLASRMSVDVEAVQIVGFEVVQWPDSSLGCPEPGKMYLQVITPGYRVVLQARDQTYEYHTNQGNRAVFCGEGALGVPVQKLRLLEIRGVAEQARNDLAQRQGIEPATVSIVEVTPVSELSQPAPCPEADQLTGPGDTYQVALRAGGKTYIYRVRDRAMVLCTQ